MRKIQFLVLSIGILVLNVLGANATQLDLPWFNNPVYSHLAASPRDLKMILEISNNAHTQKLSPMLPAQYWIIDASLQPEALHIIEQVYFKLFQSPTMRSLCLAATNGEAKYFKQIFGLNENTSEPLLKQCQEKKSSEDGKFIYRGSQTQRKYFLVLSPKDDFKFDSWTNSINSTYITLPAGDINFERYARILIHELAMVLDSKTSWGVDGNFESPKLSNDSLCEVYPVVKNQFIKNATSTLRALQIENKILSELGYKVNLSSSKSCVQNVTDVSQSILAISSVFDLEAQFARSSVERLCGHQNQTFADLITKMSKVKINVQKKEISLCEFLITPDLSNINTHESGGPRPRIGGGWELKPENLDQISDRVEIIRIKQENEVSRIQETWPAVKKSIDATNEAARRRENAINKN
jgi:hypothetical protein